MSKRSSGLTGTNIGKKTELAEVGSVCTPRAVAEWAEARAI